MSSERLDAIEKKIDRDVAGAIQLYGSPSGATTIVPKNLTDVMEFAKMMAVSGPCVRPAFRGSPGACLAIALQAFRTGADPFAVANKAYITTSRSGDEQIAYEAQYIHAVLNTSGRLAKRLRATYSGAGQKRKCTIIGHVVGEDEPLEYESPSIEEIAVKNSPLWKGDPDQQLFYYSTRAWGRRHLPEVLLGMYTPDEIRGEVIDVTPGPAALRPRPEDYVTPATASPVQHTEEPARFELTDFVGEVTEYAAAGEARDALLEMIKQARSLKALEGLWESNTSSGAVADIAEAIEDGAEPLHQAYAEAKAAFEPKSGNGQDRSQAGDQPTGPAAGATASQTEHPEERQSSTPTERRTPPIAVPQNTTGEAAPRDEPGSLAVPLRKAAGGKTDWEGTAADMEAKIATLTDPAQTAPNGGFMTANRQTLELMRSGNRNAWSTVNYRLNDRYRVLQGGEP